MRLRLKRALLVVIVSIVGSAVVVAAVPALRRIAISEVQRIVARKSIDDRLVEFRAPVEARLRADVERAGLAYPPRRLALLAFKDAKRLELYGTDVPTGDAAPAWRFIRAYPILAASGGPGPKLAKGDGQVPEGVYGIESLNPNSRYHLALRVSYPNYDDRARALADGRAHLGGDIMIHGSNASIGCLAMGDQTAEDLFVLAALAGIEHVRVIIAPSDPRMSKLATREGSPPWVAALYIQLAEAVSEYPIITQ